MMLNKSEVFRVAVEAAIAAAACVTTVAVLLLPVIQALH